MAVFIISQYVKKICLFLSITPVHKTFTMLNLNLTFNIIKNIIKFNLLKILQKC